MGRKALHSGAAYAARYEVVSRAYDREEAVEVIFPG